MTRQHSKALWITAASALLVAGLFTVQSLAEDNAEPRKPTISWHVIELPARPAKPPTTQPANSHEKEKSNMSNLPESHGAVTFKGTPLTLVGTLPKVGDDAPNATLLDNDLNDVELSSYKGKVTIVSVVPSLDTPVCDTQTRKFNEEIASLDDVVLLTISMDLPFAQKRWCGATDSKNVVALSDHRTAEFGQKWGVLVKELRLLGRSVFVVDANGDVQYVELVKEITDQPDYDAALAAAKTLADS